MEHAKSQDRIPSGWIEQFKVTGGRQIQYYHNIETGQKFFSKNDLVQYVERANIFHDSPQQTSDLDETSSEPMPGHNKKRSVRSEKTKSSETGDSEMRSEPTTEHNQIMSEPMSNQEERSSEPMPPATPATKAAETPEWLPQGWIVEVKTQGNSSRKIKCYIDQVTGRKFYSKPQVFEYLKVPKLDSSTSTPQQKKMGNVSVSNVCSQHQVLILNSVDIQIFSKASVGELAGGKTSLNLEGSDNMKSLEGTRGSSKSKKRGFGLKLGEKVAIERFTPDGLPPGWIKEIKIERKSTGIRKDPYYTDPLSGFVFRSQRDALRYLETGDITTCAIKPKKREELDFLNGETSVDANAGEISGGKTSLNLEGSDNMKSLEGTTPSSKRKRKGFGFKLGGKVAIERFTPDGLPPGWIKEIKIEMKSTGIRKDPYYTDPLSGFVFRSERDALRYLETGDIATCAIKPKKREELDFLNGETSVDKCYNIETGKNFFSKKDPVQYVQMENLFHGSPQQTSKLDETSSEPMPEHSKRRSVRLKKAKSSETVDNEMRSEPTTEHNEIMSEQMSDHEERSSKPVPLAMKADETPESLPHGWIMEVKAQGNGSQKTKASVGELAGGKTSLNLEGSDNMKSLDSSKQKHRGFGSNLEEKVVIERSVPDELPPGWIKEIKIEMKSTGIRKDPFYTDPLSGFVFRSKKDALRYLETGDITVCAIRPRKREELSFLNEFQEE